MTNANEIPPAGEPQGPPNVPPVPVSPELADREMNHDARLWAMLAHLAGFAFLLPVAPVFGSVIGPLIIWLLKKDQHAFVNEQGKEAVNFQITMLIYGFVAGLLILVCVGAVLLPAVIIADVILIIVAAIKANDGYHFRYPYPLIIRFIK